MCVVYHTHKRFCASATQHLHSTCWHLNTPAGGWWRWWWFNLHFVWSAVTPQVSTSLCFPFYCRLVIKKKKKSKIQTTRSSRETKERKASCIFKTSRLRHHICRHCFFFFFFPFCPGGNLWLCSDSVWIKVAYSLPQKMDTFYQYSFPAEVETNCKTLCLLSGNNESELVNQIPNACTKKEGGRGART